MAGAFGLDDFGLAAVVFFGLAAAAFLGEASAAAPVVTGLAAIGLVAMGALDSTSAMLDDDVG